MTVPDYKPMPMWSWVAVGVSYWTILGVVGWSLYKVVAG